MRGLAGRAPRFFGRGWLPAAAILLALLLVSPCLGVGPMGTTTCTGHWFAALLAVLATLYRRFHPPWIAHLALVLYAVDDARGWVLAREAGACTSTRWTSRRSICAPWPSACPSCSRPRSA